MALDPLAERVVGIVLSLPEVDQLALAGAGAMRAFDLHDRPTHDVDLFTPVPGEVPAVAGR